MVSGLRDANITFSMGCTYLKKIKKTKNVIFLNVKRTWSYQLTFDVKIKVINFFFYKKLTFENCFL